MSENKDEEIGAIKTHVSPDVKNMDAYGALSRGLTPEELSQSGTQKLILNDLSRAESKVRELEPFRDMYYETLAQKMVQDEKLIKTKQSEILYSFCITVGGVIIGLAKIFYEKSGGVTAIMVTIGATLIIGGILFKIYYKK